MAHTPRKRFGQHFLHDPAIINRIVSAINPQPSDTLVEIGPGRGAITLPLLRAAGRREACSSGAEAPRQSNPLPWGVCTEQPTPRTGDARKAGQRQQDLSPFWPHAKVLPHYWKLA